MFHGSMVALVTPFTSAGAIDTEALRSLAAWHLEAGTDAIVALGTTGEAATLTDSEYQTVLNTILAVAKNKIPVIAGTGTNSTAATIAKTERAMTLGADAALVVTPYYNKPTQQGLLAHYRAIAEAVPLPLILYNVPSRTGVDLLPQTVKALADVPNIVGLKDATGEAARAVEYLKVCQGKIDLFAGDDATQLSLMQAGGRGSISVVANVVPEGMHALCQATVSGEVHLATQLNDRLNPLYEALFVESNPIPCKWALAEMGRLQNAVRLPLTPLNPVFHPKVKDALIQVGCL